MGEESLFTVRVLEITMLNKQVKFCLVAKFIMIFWSKTLLELKVSMSKCLKTSADKPIFGSIFVLHSLRSANNTYCRVWAHLYESKITCNFRLPCGWLCHCTYLGEKTSPLSSLYQSWSRVAVQQEASNTIISQSLAWEIIAQWHKEALACLMLEAQKSLFQNWKTFDDSWNQRNGKTTTTKKNHSKSFWFFPRKDFLMPWRPQKRTNYEKRQIDF